MKNTGNTYDLALEGDGFFAVDYTNKATNIERTDANQQTTMYTRDGNFTLDTNGNLVHMMETMFLIQMVIIYVKPEPDFTDQYKGTDYSGRKCCGNHSGCKF